MLSSLAEAIKLYFLSKPKNGFWDNSHDLRSNRFFGITACITKGRCLCHIRQPWRSIRRVSLKWGCMLPYKYGYKSSCCFLLTFIVVMHVTIMSLIKHGVIETENLKFISNMQHEIHTHAYTEYIIIINRWHVNTD